MPSYKVIIDEEVKYIVRVNAKDKDEALEVAEEYMDSPAHKSAFEVSKVTMFKAEEALSDS